MAAKPKRTPDHINFIMVSIFLIALARCLEIYPTLLTQFLRNICIQPGTLWGISLVLSVAVGHCIFTIRPEKCEEDILVMNSSFPRRTSMLRWMVTLILFLLLTACQPALPPAVSETATPVEIPEGG